MLKLQHRPAPPLATKAKTKAPTRTCGTFDLPALRNQTSTIPIEKMIEIYYQVEYGFGPDHPQTLRAQYLGAWVRAHAKSALEYVGEKVASHRIIGFGEDHRSDVSKWLMADIVRQYAGPRVGVALEIGSDRSKDLEQIKQGTAKPEESDWFAGPDMGRIFDAARAVNAPLFPIDAPKGQSPPLAEGQDTAGHALQYRDPHMFGRVEAALERVDTLLIFIGAQHLRQGPQAFLGPLLLEKFGSDVFRAEVLDHSRETNGTDISDFSAILAIAFADRESPAFDLGGTPFDGAKVGAATFAEAVDGVVFASGIARAPSDPKDFCMP